MTRLMWAAADGAVVAKRNLIKIKRVPEVLVWVLISPFMFVMLFAYVFGNVIHMLYVDHPVEQLTISVVGQVLTEDRSGMVRGMTFDLPPLVFLRPTPLTRCDDALETLAYDPVAYLVVPRFVAAMLMLPLLTIILSEYFPNSFRTSTKLFPNSVKIFT